eukprot:1178604-Prorocentrum_minimum.AAC.2
MIGARSGGQYRGVPFLKPREYQFSLIVRKLPITPYSRATRRVVRRVIGGVKRDVPPPEPPVSVDLGAEMVSKFLVALPHPSLCGCKLLEIAFRQLGFWTRLGFCLQGE